MKIKNPTKQQVLAAFNKNYSITVDFLKVNGKPRKMLASKHPEHFQFCLSGKVPPPRQCVVYDLEQDDFRSFLYDRVQQIEFTNPIS